MRTEVPGSERWFGGNIKGNPENCVHNHHIALEGNYMNILIIPSWYPNEENPLAGCFFKEQAIALAKMGHEVVVFNASLQGRKYIKSSLNFKIRKIEYNGVVEYAYNVPSLGIYRLPSLGSKLFTLNVNKLWKYCPKKDFDIIHVHSFYPAGMAACYIKKKTDIPLIYTEHSSSVLDGKLSKAKVKQLKSLLYYSNEVISVGYNLKKALEKYTFNDRVIRIIPNMVDTSRFFYEPREKSEVYTFLVVGNLNRNKRIDWVVKAFYELRKSHNNIKLKIIGDGEQKDILLKLVYDLRLNEDVFFEGRCSRERVAEIMRSSNCFVLASKVETFGVVYIEAMACGLPIVIPEWNSSNIEILDHNYVLIQEDSVESLAHAMKIAYESRDEFDEQVISDKCVKYYSERGIASRLTNLYNEAFAEGGKDEKIP